METLLLYFGKVILCSGVTFLYYQLSLKDKTFHHYNRFYLLSAMLISLLLPLIKVDYFTIEVNNDMYMLLDKIQNFNTEKNLDNGNFYFSIIFSALGLVSFYFLGKLLYGIFKIQQFKKQFRKESFDGINFYRTDLTEAPFSYFKNLFWKNTITLHSDIGKQILKHEMVHIEQKHSFDKIFIEVITSVFWFNPFFHIIKKEINLIHEYLADKKAVKHSDTKAFAQMLLASHFSGTQLPATSPFLSSNLKKRLKMLQKPKTKFGYARRIFALPVLFTVAFAYMVNAKNKEIEETNISIQKAVSQIKNDTIKFEKNVQTDISKPASKPSDNEKRLAEIEKKMKEKGKELHNLKPESTAFNKKIEEINQLASEIGDLAAEKADKKVADYFKSPEWKIKMQSLEKMGVDMPDLSDININFSFPDPPQPPGAPGNPPVPPTAPGAPKAPKISIFKSGRTVYYEDLSKEEKNEIRKAMKQADKARRQAERVRKDSDKIRGEADKARQESEKIRIQADKMRAEAEKIAAETVGTFKNINFTTTNTSPKVIVMQADYVKKDGSGNIAINGVKKFNVNGMDDARYYVDGNEVSKKEAMSIDPKNIASVNINKESLVKGTKSEIRIQTKK
ncbi:MULTISPECIES: M56 family metallopeptidase [unclassified Chryseobacterium]|uniref:M56 family metallopeptidase n=1 Tax=unclassified Chryseobacterium TaxID=2593645 RepID=UPI000F45C8FE|nr:M56 family metallopeptidase [Chryseobacterium sp. G0240]ROI05502.1 hypothetical protein EGI16_03710 [Chryseobacterium sp. G0240]